MKHKCPRWQQSPKLAIFRAQEPKAPVTYCDHELSVVRCPSVVRRPLDYLHFRLLLQNRLMDFDETWYGWSTQGPLQVLLFFGQIRPGADPGQGKKRSRGVPFFRKLLLQTGRLQQQTESGPSILRIWVRYTDPVPIAKSALFSQFTTLNFPKLYTQKVRFANLPRYTLAFQKTQDTCNVCVCSDCKQNSTCQTTHPLPFQLDISIYTLHNKNKFVWIGDLLCS